MVKSKFQTAIGILILLVACSGPMQPTSTSTSPPPATAVPSTVTPIPPTPTLVPPTAQPTAEPVS